MDNGKHWLVTFAYYSERADVYVVTAPTADEARDRVVGLATAGIRDVGSLPDLILKEAQVAEVQDALHVEQYAEH
jgi:hypothetical protein